MFLFKYYLLLKSSAPHLYGIFSISDLIYSYYYESSYFTFLAIPFIIPYSGLSINNKVAMGVKTYSTNQITLDKTLLNHLTSLIQEQPDGTITIELPNGKTDFIS
jgi:hypothetical protein